MMEFLSTPETWVLVSFVLFMGVLAYYKVPAMVGKALDKRSDAIRTELEEAQRLREEAQAMMADYRRRQSEAEREAQGIITQANAEAERFAQEARAKLQETLERRTRLAEQKIEQAEAQAVKDVQAAAAELAIAAAGRILAAEVTGAKASALIDQSIETVGDKLN